MKRLSKTWRIARLCVLATFGIAILVLAFAYGSQWLLRWRAQRLMAQVHSIRLYQTNWADAQKLMHEWGAWGHYDGTCTSADCRYEITLGHSGFGVNEPGWFSLHVARLQFMLSALLPGLRVSTLDIVFVVHAGTIWRESAMVVVDVPPDRWNGPDEYSLIVKAKSEDRLRRSPDDPWILGSDAQLAEHPDYKVGRPSGCENCMAARITYSTHAPQSQIDELTNFNFSCFTRWRPCRWLGDVLPKAREWRLYGSPDEVKQETVPSPPWPCDIPLRALGRDFNTILAVEALQTEHKRNENGPHDVNRVRIVDILKVVGWRNGLTFEAIPFQPQFDWSDDGIAENMEPGERYLLLWDDWHDNPPSPTISLRRCGVQPDTPEARAEIAKGRAQNDGLRLKNWW